MTKQDIFKSERLSYRGINEKDSDCLVRWRSNPELIRFFRNTEPISLKSHTEWYNNSYKSNNSRFDFIIIEMESNAEIGTIGVNDVDCSAGSCEISYMIGEIVFQRKGYASESVLAMMKRMGQEHISRFYAEIHKENKASIDMIRKLGFAQCSQRDDFIVFANNEG